VGHRDGGGRRGPGKRLTLWRELGGGTHSDGSVVERPAELATAEIVIGLCDRWHCLPSQVLAEPAWVLRMLDVYQLGHRKENAEDEEEEEGEGG
jgi:hypothetical protein